jgi:hypothetical protein
MYCACAAAAAHVRFNERKNSSSFSKFQIAPTYPQDTQTYAELLMLDSTNVRILQVSKNLRDIENFPLKAE